MEDRKWVVCYCATICSPFYFLINLIFSEYRHTHNVFNSNHIIHISLCWCKEYIFEIKLIPYSTWKKYIKIFDIDQIELLCRVFVETYITIYFLYPLHKRQRTCEGQFDLLAHLFQLVCVISKEQGVVVQNMVKRQWLRINWIGSYLCIQ